MGDFFQELASRVWKGIDHISNASGYVSALLSLVLCLLVFAGVIARYLLNDPIDWRDEVSAYIFIFSCILALPYATYLESHVSAEMLFVHFPRKMQLVIHTSGYVLMVLCVGVICYYGTATTWTYYTREWRSETVNEFLLWPIMAVIPVGFFLFGLQSLSRIRATIRRIRTDESATG